MRHAYWCNIFSVNDVCFFYYMVVVIHSTFMFLFWVVGVKISCHLPGSSLRSEEGMLCVRFRGTRFLGRGWVMFWFVLVLQLRCTSFITASLRLSVILYEQCHSLSFFFFSFFPTIMARSQASIQMGNRDLQLVSWNVRGLGSVVKRGKVFKHLKSLCADVIFLQETHVNAACFKM